MAVFAEHLVLGRENSLDGSHQGTTFAGKITEHFFTEIRFKQVAATYSNSESNYTLVCFTGGILVNSEAAV